MCMGFKRELDKLIRWVSQYLVVIITILYTLIIGIFGIIVGRMLVTRNTNLARGPQLVSGILD